MLAILFRYRLKMLLSFFKSGAGIGKTIMIIAVVLLAIFSIVSLSLAIYEAIDANPELGEKILNMLIIYSYHGMFVLLLFTGLSLAIFTVFFGNDLGLLFSLPIEPNTLFRYKFLEALILNIRMSIIFLTPSIILLGLFYHASLLFYLIAIFITFFMASIPGSLGIILSSLFVNRVSRAKMKNITAVAGSLLGVGIWAGINSTLGMLDKDNGPVTADNIPSFGITSSPMIKYLPSGWASKTAMSSAMGNWQEIILPLTLLTVSAVVLWYIAMRITRRHYRQGLVEDSGEASSVVRSASSLGGSPLLAHVRRDLILLYRQPQVLIQILLMFIFMTLFPFIAGKNQPGMEKDFPLSIPVAIFALMFGSQFGSRIIPLERQAFYRNFMIPGGARLVLLEKLLLGLGITLVCSVIVGTAHFLGGKAEKPDYIIYISEFAVVGFSFGLPIGLYFADFAWEHPKRMLKGGGSFIVVVVTLILGAFIFGLSYLLKTIIPPILTISLLSGAALLLAAIISLLKLSNYEWVS